MDNTSIIRAKLADLAWASLSDEEKQAIIDAIMAHIEGLSNTLDLCY